MTESKTQLAVGMKAQLDRLTQATAAGVPRIGWKIGINDHARQQQLGIDGPVVGVLDGERTFRSGEACGLAPGALAAAEAEVAVWLKRDVRNDESADRARTAIAAMAPAIELVDYQRPRGSLAEILAHSIFHFAVVFGEEQPFTWERVPEGSWPQLLRNGTPVADRDPALVPDDLGEIVRHVARLLAQHGERLRAGDRVICGSFVQPQPVEAGDQIAVDFGPLGWVEVRLTDNV